MPASTRPFHTPSLRRHKPSPLGVVTLNGIPIAHAELATPWKRGRFLKASRLSLRCPGSACIGRRSLAPLGEASSPERPRRFRPPAHPIRTPPGAETGSLSARPGPPYPLLRGYYAPSSLSGGHSAMPQAEFCRAAAAPGADRPALA
jgi:hypothetical protein